MIKKYINLIPERNNERVRQKKKKHLSYVLMIRFVQVSGSKCDGERVNYGIKKTGA